MPTARTLETIAYLPENLAAEFIYIAEGKGVSLPAMRLELSGRACILGFDSLQPSVALEVFKAGARVENHR